MNVSQNKQPKREPSKNQNFVPPQQKIQRISQKDIKIPIPIKDQTKDLNITQLKLKEITIDELKKQNENINKKNKQLLLQLQKFSKRLDQEINNRFNLNGKKSKKLLKPQEKQSIEIQNLYKKIEIYKKQNFHLKAKISNDNEIKLNDSENKLKIYIKENEELKSQIKALNKIIKKQQKGLIDIGAEGFLKITSQNDKMREQIRKLRIQIDQVQRKYRTNPSQDGKKLFTPQGERQKVYFQRIGLKKQHTFNHNSFHSRKKDNLFIRAKTQTSSLQKDFPTKQNQSQLNLNKQNKILEKYQSKIRSLNTQKLRQKEIIQNLKIQIIQKDKEINYLREKIDLFRKTPKIKRNQHSSQSIKEQQKNSKPFFVSDQSVSLQQKGYKKKKNQQDSRQIYDQYSQQSRVTNNKQSVYTVDKNRYPRIQDRGLKSDAAYKWNHHQFSSKIKEIQVYTHPSGHIQYIHVRYQKGQPQKSMQLSNKKFSALICQEFEQYVTQIKGGFKNKYLQYLILKTNGKRLAEFGNTNLEKQSQNFTFSIQSNEYPCALFGQNEINGVTRFGCFIQKL